MSIQEAMAGAHPATRPSHVRTPSLDWLEHANYSITLLPPQDQTSPAPAPGAGPEPGPAPQAAPSELTHADVVISGPREQLPPPKPEISNSDWEAKIVQSAHDFPRELVPQMENQLLQYLKGKDVPQLDAIGMLSDEDREMLSAILDGLTNLRSSMRADANLPMARRIRPWLDAANRLRLQAGLSIPKIALCSKVGGFGVYDPIASNSFPVGRDHPLVVYCEVENFSSRLNGDGMWESKLTQEVTIYDSAGKVVAGEKRQEVVDHSRGARRDFFVGRRVVLPAKLTPGSYSLRVSIQDPLARRVAEATTPIVIK